MGMESPDKRREADDSYRARKRRWESVPRPAPDEGAYGQSSGLAFDRALDHRDQLDSGLLRLSRWRFHRLVIPAGSAWCLHRDCRVGYETKERLVAFQRSVRVFLGPRN
jgi:hypothetical protein